MVGTIRRWGLRGNRIRYQKTRRRMQSCGNGKRVNSRSLDTESHQVRYYKTTPFCYGGILDLVSLYFMLGLASSVKIFALRRNNTNLQFNPTSVSHSRSPSYLPSNPSSTQNQCFPHPPPLAYCSEPLDTYQVLPAAHHSRYPSGGQV